MSRFQISLNVRDVDASVAFYSQLFGVASSKHREGYANFVVSDPPLKLILIENEGAPGTINHVGIEVEDTDAVVAATHQLARRGLSFRVDETHTCCYASQDKVWTQDPDGVPWETYTVVAEADHFGARAH